MSGIVAVLAPGSVSAIQPLVRRMTDFMSVRGPDAQETWCQEAGAGSSVGLGAALLRNTVESGAERQPLTLNGQVWIAADARIDGRPDVLRELRTAGRMPTHDASDAELILHAYDAWGDACVEHLSGDIAFAVWDGRTQRLVCARDHFGVVPFYYAHVGDWFICSNTLDCVRQHPGVSTTLNDQAIADHLIFGSNQDWSTTRFSDVRRLPPGHMLSYRDGAVSVRRYWTPAAYESPIRYQHSDDYVDHFRQLLDHATADRLRTLGAGISMSGGLDSTAVAASARSVLASGGVSCDLRAYTWVYERVIQDDERHFAGLAAEALDIPIQFLAADEGLLNGRPGLAPGQRSPLQLVAASGGRVMLSGLGGDPALCPDTHYWSKLVAHGSLRQLLTDVRTHLRSEGQRPPLYLRAHLDRWLRRPVWRPPFPSWLAPEFARRLDLETRLEQLTETQLSDRTRTGMQSPFWSDVLTNRDPDHTQVPVRTRHPFFDLRLVRYLMAIPAVPWLVDKRVLRDAMKDRLPDAVRLRPKTPLAGWPHHALAIRQGVPAWMEDLARTPELAPYIDLELLWSGLHAPETMGDHEFQSIVRALNLAVWFRRTGLSRAEPPHGSAFYA